MMRAATYAATGAAAEVLRVGERPRPSIGPGEVLVRVHASGINPADVKRRAGWNGATMSHPLVIPHCDGAGVIAATGAGVDASQIGTRVWLWNAQGGYGEAGRAFGTAAEYVVLPAAQAVPLSDALTFDEGACLGVPALTAWFAVFGAGPVTGHTVMIHGAAGAVGLAATQMACASGARVIAVTSVRGMPLLPVYDALTVLDRHADDVPGRVAEITGGTGADLVVEIDLAANMATDLACLAPHGTIASYSCSSDPTPPLPYYAFADLGAQIRFIQGFRLSLAARARAQADIDRHAATGALRPHIAVRFPLDAIADAHARVEGGEPGQTVLTMPEHAS